MKSLPPFSAVLSAPTFSVGILCNEDEVTGLHYLPPQAELAPRSPLARETVRQVRAYLADPRFEFGLPLAPAGTHFQRKVWAQIAAIPLGETRSYGEVATALRSGPRAVGGACGANPYPLVVPCHRVLAANRKLGGFGGADKTRGDHFLLDIKRWLLAHEGH